MSELSQTLQLMREMRAPAEDGFRHPFTPIPPRSHRWMMDVSETEETRVFGWALWRTVDIDRKGSFGPVKKKRTAWANDERGDLDVRHIEEDLGISQANASDALRRLIESGRMARDEKGRIRVRGDAPLPERIKSEDEGREGKDPWMNLFCTEILPEPLIQSFQRLEKKRRAQYVRRYLEMPTAWAAHLKTLAADARSEYTWLYLQRKEFADKLAADVMFAARAASAEYENEVFAVAGFIDPETRGRPKVKRPLVVALDIKVKPDDYFCTEIVENESVQNSEDPAYRNDGEAVQKTPSLLSSLDVLRVSEKGPAPAPEDHALTASNYVVLRVEAIFGKFDEADPVKAQFAQLATELKLPDGALGIFIEDKLAEKRRKRYPVDSAGALLAFLRKDCDAWARQNADVIRVHSIAWESTPAAVDVAPSLDQQIEELIRLKAEYEAEPGHPGLSGVQRQLAELRAQRNGHTKGATV